MATSAKKKRKRVFCSKCAELLLLEGVAPICVAKAQFERGPLRAKIGIKGYVSAEKRNRYNNCRYFKRFDLHSAAKKRFVIEKLREEGVEAHAISLRQYSLKLERARKQLQRKSLQKVLGVPSKLLKVLEKGVENEHAEQASVEDAGRTGEFESFESVKKRFEEIKRDAESAGSEKAKREERREEREDEVER